MYAPFKKHHIEYIASVPSVNNEFADKVKELDKRLQKNGLAYKNWDTMTDHQQGIFSQGLFLDGQCADNVQNYVKGAAHSCEPCAAEELHHHSPALMRAIDQEKEKLPSITVRIGENLNSLNETIDKLGEEFLFEFSSGEEADASVGAIPADPAAVEQELEAALKPTQEELLQEFQKFYAKLTQGVLGVLTPMFPAKGKKAAPKTDGPQKGKPPSFKKDGTLKPATIRDFTNTTKATDPRNKAVTEIAKYFVEQGAEPNLGFRKYKLDTKDGTHPGILGSHPTAKGVIRQLFAQWPDDHPQYPGFSYRLKIEAGGGASGPRNIGNTAEGILAIAMYLRIAHNKVPSIDDIFSVAYSDTFRAQAEEKRPNVTISQEVPTDEGDKEDLIVLKVGLGKGVYSDLVNPDYRGDFEPVAQACLQVVSRKVFSKLRQVLYVNGVENVVYVAAVGTEDEVSTKVDVRLRGGNRGQSYQDLANLPGLGRLTATAAEGANEVVQLANMSVKMGNTQLLQTAGGWDDPDENRVGIGSLLQKMFAFDPPPAMKQAYESQVIGPQGKNPVIGKKKNPSSNNHAERMGGGNYFKSKFGELVMVPLFDSLARRLNIPEDATDEQINAKTDAMKRMVDGIQYAATQGESDVGFVDVGGNPKFLDFYDSLLGAFDKQSPVTQARLIKGDKFPDMRVSFRDNSGQIEPETSKSGERTGKATVDTSVDESNPYVYLYDASKNPEPPTSTTDDNVLFYLRPKGEAEANTPRLYIQMGEGLVDLLRTYEDEAEELAQDSAELESDIQGVESEET